MFFYLCIAVVIATINADSEPQREYILFEKADADLSGELDQKEFDLILEKFDINGDHNVTLQEFVQDWTNIFQLGAAAEARALFDAADGNDDGILEHKDLVQFFKYFDMDHDGGIDMNEFLTQWGELELVPSGPENGSTVTSTTSDPVFG